jgi:pyruvate formate lyase activating enzyme
MAAATLAQTIDSLTTEGVLYEKLPDNRVRCYACGHRCVILDGLRGICKVRYNKDGVLYVPHGYVGALQCDPTEKKPFFHVFPGSNTLTFGMLGCDFHCAYCTDEATLVITSNGPIPIGQLFSQAQVVSELDGDTIATLPGIQVYTHTGQLRPVRGIFRHRYSGQMVRIEPHYLPSIKVTPEHEFLAISRTELSAGGGEPHFIPASQLTADHCLAIPKRFSFSKVVVYNAAEILTPLAKWHTDNSIRRHLYEDSQYYYVPIKGLSTYTFSGYVYNLEVEGDHSYLAQFVSTHNCQNYITSQALRDPNAGSEPALITPEQMVALATRYKARLIGTSYNEPLITAEWAVDIFRRAKEQGFKTCFISNGNGTPEVLEYIRPFTDCYKVDLKSMQEKNYRALGGQLKNVLETIERLVAMGFWVEIVTLVIPGFNDSDAELKQAAEFLAAISRDIPWHVTAFHKDYKMQDPDNTPATTLLRAAEIGRAAGLRFVYAGNLPGMTRNYENTYCPECRTLLIERFGFRIMQNRLQPGGLCPSCAYKLPGIWE